jgi:hypothetical protein
MKFIKKINSLFNQKPYIKIKSSIVRILKDIVRARLAVSIILYQES